MKKLICITTSALLFASAALHAGESTVRVGLDATIEGSTALSGVKDSGNSLQGMGLATLDWESPSKPEGFTITLHASVLGLAGEGPTSKFLNDFLAASNQEGYESARLYSWWAEAVKGDFSVRAGALLADEEFAVTNAGGTLFNSAFGWPAFISANTVNTGPAFFVPALGVRVQKSLGSEFSAIRFGVYDGNSFNSKSGDPKVNRYGISYDLNDSHGAFAIAELEVSPDKGSTYFKAGLWTHTAKVDDVLYDTNGKVQAISGGTPRTHSYNFGAYGLAERVLSGKQGQAGFLTGSIRAGFAPSDRNTVAWSLDSALAYTGLIPTRSSDVTSFGVVHAAISNRFSKAAAAAGLSDSDYEQVYELSHNIVLSERLSIQPDLQYIRHLGAAKGGGNALALIVRVKASF